MAIIETIRKHRDSFRRNIDIIVIGLIVYSAITIAIETLAGLPPGVEVFLDVSRIVLTGIFTVEYVIRVYIAKSKRRFVFSFYGIIDLLAILPVYLGLGHEAQVLRAFRLLHLFRMTHHEASIQRIGKAIRQTRGEVAVFSVFTLVLLYLSAIGIYYFEHPAQPENFGSILDGMWWAVATLTTVGYGDIYPVTPGGRLFAGAIVLIGLGIVAVPSGLFAAALTSVRRAEESEAKRNSASVSEDPSD